MSRAAADVWISQHEDTLANRVVARKDALDSLRWPQVLLTHTWANVPADGVSTAPNNLNAVTTDNGDGWSRLNLTIGGKWDAAIEINNYGDSRGQGCEYVAYVREAGTFYRKAYKVEGHQQDRLSDWVPIEVPFAPLPPLLRVASEAVRRLVVQPKPPKPKPAVVYPDWSQAIKAKEPEPPKPWWRRALAWLWRMISRLWRR